MAQIFADLVLIPYSALLMLEEVREWEGRKGGSRRGRNGKIKFEILKMSFGGDVE